MEHERHGGYRGDQDPPEHRNEKTVLHIQFLRKPIEPPDQIPDPDGDDRGDGERIQVVLPVAQRTDDRKQHGAAGHDQQLSQNIGNRIVVHQPLTTRLKVIRPSAISKKFKTTPLSLQLSALWSNLIQEPVQKTFRIAAGNLISSRSSLIVHSHPSPESQCTDQQN